MQWIHYHSGLLCSEIQHSRSQSLLDAVKTIKKNNNVALKGAIQEAETLTSGRISEDINKALKKELDLFASVVNIKVIMDLFHNYHSVCTCSGFRNLRLMCASFAHRKCGASCPLTSNSLF